MEVEGIGKCLSSLTPGHGIRIPSTVHQVIRVVLLITWVSHRRSSCNVRKYFERQLIVGNQQLSMIWTLSSRQKPHRRHRGSVSGSILDLYDASESYGLLRRPRSRLPRSKSSLENFLFGEGKNILVCQQEFLLSLSIFIGVGRSKHAK